VRLPLEVVAAVRERVAGRGVVGCRYLGDDVVEGGNTLDDAAWFGVELARAGLDFLSISKGGKFEDARQPKVGWAVYPYTGRSGYECMPTIYSDARGPFARNVPLAARIRGDVRAAGLEPPIVAAGGICEFAQAEALLVRGLADFVASARQSLADPDWFLKILEGRGAEIRRCEFTNYCEALDQQHKQVTCKLWDREALDAPDVTLASDGKRRLVAPRWRR
jgi:dimethylglycine catabolism A